MVQVKGAFDEFRGFSPWMAIFLIQAGPPKNPKIVRFPFPHYSS